ncbi:MAG: hypothetical protein WBH82_06215, partial [Arcanobacterium sp.]
MGLKIKVRLLNEAHEKWGSLGVGVLFGISIVCQLFTFFLQLAGPFVGLVGCVFCLPGWVCFW